MSLSMRSIVIVFSRFHFGVARGTGMNFRPSPSKDWMLAGLVVSSSVRSWKLRLVGRAKYCQEGMFPSWMHAFSWSVLLGSAANPYWLTIAVFVRSFDDSSWRWSLSSSSVASFDSSSDEEFHHRERNRCLDLRLVRVLL